MVKVQTEKIRIRLPKETRARLEIEAQEANTDMSKLIRKCIECFVKQNHCLVKKELRKFKGR